MDSYTLEAIIRLADLAESFDENDSVLARDQVLDMLENIMNQVHLNKEAPKQPVP